PGAPRPRCHAAVAPALPTRWPRAVPGVRGTRGRRLPRDRIAALCRCPVPPPSGDVCAGAKAPGWGCGWSGLLEICRDARRRARTVLEVLPVALPGPNCHSRRGFVPQLRGEGRILTAPRGANPSCCHHQTWVSRAALIRPNFGAEQHPSKQRLPPGAPPRCGCLSPVREEGGKVECSVLVTWLSQQLAETAHPNGLPFYPEKHTPGTGQSASLWQPRIWSFRRREKKVDVTAMAQLFGYVDMTDSGFIAAILSIAFNPFFWNVVARWEHKTRALSRVCGSPHTACYCLGTVILMLNCVRSHCFTEAMKSQPKLEGLDSHWAYYSGLVVLAVGTLFVISSFLALGFTGTFLGDYFGILMEAKVTSFPFSVLDNPMYWGSTAIYLGWSLMHASPAGLVLTAVVAISYTIAVLYEGPFTEEIYRRKQKGAKNK
uniref:Phosphatidylethanolamine N-methyltransferase n=1 Tax=Anser cygnoides TaxID=8845 RepID=A0A8B9E3L9_ANSCY